MTTVSQAAAARDAAPEPSPSAALAIRGGQDFWDAKQIAALGQLGIKDATNADLAIYFHYCQKTGLDPFSRQIYMLARRVKEGGEWVTKQTIQIGIDGYRVVAARAARRDGAELSYGDTTWYDGDGNAYPVWVRPEPPAAASTTVLRDGRPFPGVARFASFAAYKDGKLTGQWAVMPDHMIAKCAEAQALRRAFPHDLGGTHTEDEVAHYEREEQQPRQRARGRTIAATVTREPKRQHKPHTDAGEQGINRPPAELLAAQWERLGITEPDEQLNLTAALAGTEDVLDSLDGIGPEEQQRIAGRIAACASLADVHALIDSGEAPGGQASDG